MITENMQLNSKKDAAQWASDFGLSTDDQGIKLADWIWENKPYIGCTINDHPISTISDEVFWEVVE